MATIYSATILTAPNFTDEDNPTITYVNESGNNVTALEAGIFNEKGGLSYAQYRAIPKTGKSYTFELTAAERNNLWKAASDSNKVVVTFFIRTTIGSTYYYSYLTRTLTIKDPNPIVKGSVIDVNDKTIALTGDATKLIMYHSSAEATMTAEARKGAAINLDLCIIRNGINTGYGLTHTFNNTESGGFIFSAEDSRGNVGKDTITPDIVNYTKLTCYVVNNKPDALGNMTVACTGQWFNGSFGKETNTLTAQCWYGKTGDPLSGNAIDMEIVEIGESYYAYADLVIPNFSQTQGYVFEVTVKDKLETVTTDPYVASSRPIFHWGENDFVFEVPVTFNAGVTSAISLTDTEGGEGDTYDGSKTITGNLRLKGDGTNYGNYLLFGDSTFCYIAELTDDIMTIHAKKINLDASSGVYVGNYAIPILDKGTWTPTLNSSAISSYTTQYGWYSKMGQSVTVGFYIKATCKSGYNSTAISISGLPFTPMYSGAGGGMCSGAYVAANQNFQCYVAETGKTITTRTQACNNTSATNLTTSASGCWYPSGGGEITLSGTITFIANS